MPSRERPVRVERSAAELGRHLLTWRKLQNLTAEQVAERAHVTRTTLRRLEHGEPGVGLDVFLGVARALGQLDRVVTALDPYETDLGRARAEETLPERVRR
ncbi:helix-turn-helix domain-containing protein [Microlunatus flavus]|uniref:Helix-turn-helix domain-containing protein n=1 Tax=Microlunatus flavus TaxID=1036181 RepID=A0A1H9IYR8_9ACTN|nr:helix-turn-helix transcriptional regulator [Microlunatus flavus]SEQ79535.1 Helix-turn-helix domain-containing protein [Microlunatus flavus]